MRKAKKPLPFEVWALVAGGFTIALGYGVVAPVLPQFAKEFGVTNFQATAVISSFALMRLVFAPVSGLIVNKLGERTTYVTGLAIVAVMTGVAVFVTDYWQLLASRAIAGTGSTMFTIAATALMIKVMPPSERGRVSSINSASFLLGNLLGPVLGALVAGFGLRAPFVVYFFALMGAALVVWFALRNSTFAARNIGPQPSDPQTFKEALNFKQYRGVLISTFAFGWASFGVRVSAVPLFVSAVLLGSESQAGWVLAAYAAGNAALVLPSGVWNDKFGRKPLLVLGLATVSVGFLILPFTTNVLLAMGAMVIAGIGSAFTNPAQQATIADVVGKRSGGSVVAATQMTADFGAILGPLVAGLLIDGVGFTSAFIVTAILLGLASVVWIFIPDSRQLVDSLTEHHKTTQGVEVVSAVEPVATGPVEVVSSDENEDKEDGTDKN